MKIVTWNINGIRTFRGGIQKALHHLDADIVCLQETKVTRDLLDEKTAIVDGYNSYFSYSRGRSGYSGVATYCKDGATPFAAEEGLSGLLTNQEGAVGCYGDQCDFSNEELQMLDNEGRAVITRHKIICEEKEQTLTVINVYCPRADPEKPERKRFKLQFYRLLRCRAEAVVKDGSHVIVLGDVNTSHRQIDHCDPADSEDFDENPGRKWLNEFLHNTRKEDERSAAQPVHVGKFVDTFRFFHPTRTHAFTCWSTVTGARRTNYGTRIDYIFADSRLVQQFVGADIWPEVEGSDHCPVWGQLSCSLLPSAKPPPLCTRYLPEFAGKQQKLSRFFVKVDQKSVPIEQIHSLPGSQEEEEKRENLIPLAAENVPVKKRLLVSDPVVPKSKKLKKVNPQGSLLYFFKPKLTNGKQSEQESPKKVTSSLLQNPSSATSELPVKDAELSSGHGAVESLEDVGKKHLASAGRARSRTEGSSGFWKSVLRGPPPPPQCKVHGEACVLRTVKKEGPNMGKQFFVCARPQGHSSNPQARCNYFAWVEKGK